MGVCTSLGELLNTQTLSSLSPTLEPTVTNVWCLDLKRPSLLPTLAETVLPSAGSLSLIQKDVEWNSVHLTLLATLTWPSLQLFKLVWTGSRIKWTLAYLATGTCTKLLLQNSELGVKGVPSTLAESVAALEKDHA